MAHKSSLIMRILQDKDLEMLFSPSHTPEFSAVENVFATMKQQLGSFQFTSVKKTAEEMMKILFSLKETDMHVFYRKVLRNI